MRLPVLHALSRGPFPLAWLTARSGVTINSYLPGLGCWQQMCDVPSEEEEMWCFAATARAHGLPPCCESVARIQLLLTHSINKSAEEAA